MLAMTNIHFGRTDMISGIFPTMNLYLIACLLVTVWVFSHLNARRFQHKFITSLFFVVQLAISSASIWSILQLFGRHVLLSTSWPLWSNALLSGSVIEIMIVLYRHEYQMTSRIKASIMLTLRTTTIVIITLILTQPIMREQHKKGVERTIAVLLDDSASMHFSDNQLTISEKLDIATLYKLTGLDQRPHLDTVRENLQNIIEALEMSTNDLELPLNLDNNYIEIKFSELREQLSLLMAVSAKSVRSAIIVFNNIERDVDHYGGTSRSAAAKTVSRLKTQLLNPLLACTALLKSSSDISKRYLKLQATIEATRFNTLSFLNTLPGIKDTLDTAFYMQLNFTTRELIDKSAVKTRAELSRTILLGKDKSTALSKIKKTHEFTLIRFTDKQQVINQDQLKVPIDHSAGENQRTDLTGALEFVANHVPAENLAGIIILSDGCHNTASSPDSIAKQLARQQVPICAIRIGGTKVPRDNAIMNVVYPTSIFLGEKLSIEVELQANDYKERELELELHSKQKIVASKKIFINTDRFKSKVKLQITPDKNGIFSYKVKLKELAGEATTKNNTWDISVAVTDDRTNVLLIDNHPRWEYRYLRNLFHGRDKSVQLQHLLISPDSVEGMATVVSVPASADREFGDDHATEFPLNKKEWSKFDVIILGDLSPDILTDELIETLSYCVKERGALLICIAGQLHMPHAFNSQKLQELLPIKYENTPGTEVPPYKIGITAYGRHHTIMQQSESFSENTQIWQKFPPMYWRLPINGVKDEANIVAYAKTIINKQDELFSVAQTLRSQKEQRAKDALIVVQKKGIGRVIMLNMDRTWRLRYGYGDNYHHQFWKQVINWGIGDKLRSGNDFVRLGTPEITYTNNDKITVMVKVQDKEFKPVNNGTFHLTISTKGKNIRKRLLRYKEESAGKYEVIFDPFTEAGRYTAQLFNADLIDLGVVKKGESVSTEFIIVSSKAPIEISELAARDDVLRRIVELTNGKMNGLLGINSFISKFGDGNRFITINKDIAIWDSFGVLVLLLSLISIEWVVRKLGGLV